jgi:hypothetical protein
VHLRRRYWAVAVPCALIGVVLVDATRGGTVGAVTAIVALAYLVLVFIVDRRLRRRATGGTTNRS